eukprot:s2583_g7.t1
MPPKVTLFMLTSLPQAWILSDIVFCLVFGVYITLHSVFGFEPTTTSMASGPATGHGAITIDPTGGRWGYNLGPFVMHLECTLCPVRRAMSRLDHGHRGDQHVDQFRLRDDLLLHRALRGLQLDHARAAGGDAPGVHHH